MILEGSIVVASAHDSLHPTGTKVIHELEVDEHYVKEGIFLKP